MSLLPPVVVIRLVPEHVDRPAGAIDRADRHALTDLDRLPAGTRVRVQLGDRTLRTASAVCWLHRALGRLDVQLEGTAAAVAAWEPAVRSGEVFGGVEGDD